MKFNIFKKQIEDSFVESERKLETKEILESKTGTKIFTTVVAIGLAGIVLVGGIQSAQRDVSEQNSRLIGNLATQNPSYSENIYEVTLDDISKLELESEGRLLFPNNQNELTLCDSDDLATTLPYYNINIINIDGKLYSKSGIVTTIEYDECIYICEQTVNAKMITANEDGEEKITYVAPAGYQLKGDKAYKTSYAQKIVSSDGEVVYRAPAGYTLTVEKENRHRVVSTDKIFNTREELRDFLLSIDPYLTLEDVTITTTETKTFKEIPSLYQSEIDKTLKLK